MSRGYFGIGAYAPKTVENIGTLWRSAFQMGASFIYVIGKRYKKHPKAPDTCKSFRHIPLYEYETFEEFLENRPVGAQLVGIEFCGKSKPLQMASHPTQAIYLLGSEDNGLPKEAIENCQIILEIPSIRMPSYNMATAGAIVMYDRLIKTNHIP